MGGIMINVILFRGLAGNVYSTGLDVLALDLKKIEGVDYVMVVPYTDYQMMGERIAGFKDPTILIGHSYGVTSSIRMARNLPTVKFPTLISFDPSQYVFDSNEVPSNIAKVLNFYQKGRWPFGIGNQKLYRNNSSQQVTGITNEYVSGVTHASIEDHKPLHNKAIEKITKIAESM
jgi:hypothetical protein